MDLETRKIYESPKERKDQLPKYQAAGTFLREGTWNPRNRTMQQDPNRGGGQEGAYGMNKGALDFGTLPMENIPIPNQNTNPNPFATPNAYNPMLMAQRGGHLPQYQEESNNVPSSRWSNKGVSDYVKNNPEMFTIKPSPFTNTPCDIKTADGECVNTEQVMYPDLFKTETETLEDKKIKELQDLGVDPNMIKQAKQMNLFSKQKGGNIYTQENPHQGATFEAERPEVVKHGAGNHPIALANGGTINNSNNFTKITGNRHSDAEGGVQLAGAEGGFVYSDFIKVPKDLEKQINSLV
jgi:hypothetical protein